MIPAPYKCVGGKSKLVSSIAAHLPSKFSGYVEPFLGGGALFRHLAPQLVDKPVVLADAAPGVALTWNQIRAIPQVVHDALALLQKQYGHLPPQSDQAPYDGIPVSREQMYYQMRAAWNAGQRTAARHIFLRNTAFNGLWRVNQQGGMNVPWGKYVRFNVPDIAPLHTALVVRDASLVITNEFYVDTFDAAESGWLVYVDPPYLDEFDQYTSDRFSHTAHIDLLCACQALAARGVHVMYSNRWSDRVLALLREFWPEATPMELSAQQTMAASSSARKPVRELLASVR